MGRAAIVPDDLVFAAGVCRGVLLAHVDDDWDRPAADVDWTCRQSLEHVGLIGVAYALRLAARTTVSRGDALQARTDATVVELIETMHDSFLVLAEVARAAPQQARGHHPAGMADAEGWLAMGIDEALLHTADIVHGLGGAFSPPDDLCRAVLDRLFPWWPTDQLPGTPFAGQTVAGPSPAIRTRGPRGSGTALRSRSGTAPSPSGKSRPVNQLG